MLIFKITLTISGDRFFPSKAIPYIDRKYILESFQDAEKDLTHGVIFYMHPHLFGIEGNGTDYEEWFVKLLEENFDILHKHGAEEINLFTEVYYSDDQCNFEILDREMLKRIRKFNVAYPVSVYRLSEKEILNILD
jgi:hypothetical protein